MADASQVIQSSLSYSPEIQPAMNEMVRRGLALSEQQYTPYEYNRIARFDPMQLQAQQAAANMQVSPYLGQAAGLASAAGKYAPGTFGSGYTSQLGSLTYNPTRFQEQRVAAERAAAERAATGRFTDPGVASSYMSPYMQNVVDIQKREAQRQADISGTQRQAEAIRAGAFGGSGRHLVEAEAQRNLAQQMGDIQARGSQAAYEQAAQQFQTDEQRNLAMQQTNVQAQLQAALANQQTGLAAALANQAKNLEAQQLSEQSRQFGADYRMRGLQAAQQGDLESSRMREQSRQFGAGLGLQAAGQFGQLGRDQFGQARDIIGMQATAGAERQALDQRKLTQDYEDFLAQRRFPYQQQQFAMEMLRGMPMQSTESIYKAPPSLAAQIPGLAAMYMGGQRAGFFANGGLAGLGLYNMTR